MSVARLAGTLAVSLLTLAACGQRDTPTAVDHLSAHADQGASYNSVSNGKPGAMPLAVRKSTTRFNSTKQAIAAGHVPTDECVAHPVLGGMGQHWVNGALIDHVFDPSKPEAVLYEHSGDGKVKLVAVEYIVIDVGQPHPSFDGRLCDVGGVPPLGSTPHYSLHVWVHRANPNGLYTPFNPNVSCN